MDIKDFLLARIAEDEREATGHLGAEYYQDGLWPEACSNRVLAECAAKRAIIEAQHWEPRPRPSDSELQSRASHPSYEYATTEGPRKQWDDADEPPEGEGWERNTDIGYGQGWVRLDYTEESYWRRLKPEAERKEWKQYIPASLRALAAVYSDHPDYQQEWALSVAK